MPPGKSKLKPTPRGADIAMEIGKSLKKKFGTVQQAREMTHITPGKKHSTLVSFFQVNINAVEFKIRTIDCFGLNT